MMEALIIVSNSYYCCISYVQVLEGISDIRDESDRTGMRVVIEVCPTTFHLYLLLSFSL